MPEDILSVGKCAKLDNLKQIFWDPSGETNHFNLHLRKRVQSVPAKRTLVHLQIGVKLPYLLIWTQEVDNRPQLICGKIL